MNFKSLSQFPTERGTRKIYRGKRKGRAEPLEDHSMRVKIHSFASEGEETITVPYSLLELS